LHPVKETFRDFINSVSAYRLWFYMANNDIRLRYRGSTLGPIWITLTMMIFIGALSIVYTKLYKQEIHEYIPFLTCGILIWTFISAVIHESSETFLASKDFIEGMKIPYFLFIFRLISRNILVFLHNFIVYLLVVIIFHIKIDWYTLLAIPGFLLVVANLVPICIIISLVGTRFRDLPPIITAVTTVFFFISPITWRTRWVGEETWIIQLNPVAYFLDLIRSPLLGNMPNLISVYVTLSLVLIFWWVALALFSRHAKKIPFWL
jgi:lipopolysaccharide transport system permease protein